MITSKEQPVYDKKLAVRRSKSGAARAHDHGWCMIRWLVVVVTAMRGGVRAVVSWPQESEDAVL